MSGIFGSVACSASQSTMASTAWTGKTEAMLVVSRNSAVPLTWITVADSRPDGTTCPGRSASRAGADAGARRVTALRVAAWSLERSNPINDSMPSTTRSAPNSIVASARALRSHARPDDGGLHSTMMSSATSVAIRAAEESPRKAIWVQPARRSSSAARRAPSKGACGSSLGAASPRPGGS